MTPPPPPVPLFRVGESAPHAYACGHCGFVRVSYSCFRKWEPCDTESTRAEALRCCACFECGAFVPRDGRTSSLCCAACEEKHRVVEAARRDVATALAMVAAASFEDAERSHSAAFRFAIEGGRTGRAFICDDHGGVFEQAFARLDPIPEDAAPKVYSERLQRSGVASVMRLVAELCGDHDATLTAWEVLP